jgi:hypothetical protein
MVYSWGELTTPAIWMGCAEGEAMVADNGCSRFTGKAGCALLEMEKNGTGRPVRSGGPEPHVFLFDGPLGNGRS